MKKRKERDDMIKTLKEKSQKPSTNQSRTTSQGANKSSTKPSTSTRLNEPLMTGRRSNRFSRGSRGLGSTGNRKFLVDQADREAWVRKLETSKKFQIERDNNIINFVHR